MAASLPDGRIDPESIDWDSAACLPYDTELFFPGLDDHDDRVEAKEVCGQCPIRLDCLTYSVHHREMWGVWGGESQTARREMMAEYQFMTICEWCNEPFDGHPLATLCGDGCKKEYQAYQTLKREIGTLPVFRPDETGRKVGNG